MSNIDYQSLRDAAEAIKVVANPQKLLSFRMKVTPQVVLALLDELDKWQQESSAWQAVAEKQLALAADAEKRIAELEVRKLAAVVSVPAERAAFETFMEKRFKDLIDRRLVKNGDGEYFAWDMQVAWIVWQERAAMLKCSDPVTDNTNQQFESLSRGDK